jgi:hypothetical protein
MAATLLGGRQKVGSTERFLGSLVVILALGFNAKRDMDVMHIAAWVAASVVVACYWLHTAPPSRRMVPWPAGPMKHHLVLRPFAKATAERAISGRNDWRSRHR